MSDVKCKACGKRYNYNECGCCPNCGAYNRPPRRERVTAEGDVFHISDEEYQNRAKRTETQDGKVCFEKKVCYEDQAHSSSQYTRPSAFADGYVDTEEQTTAYDEAVEDRFQVAADAAEERFEAAEDRFNYDPEEPVERHKPRSHAKTAGFDAGDLGEKLNHAADSLMGDFKKRRHKSYTQKTGSQRSKSGVKMLKLVGSILVAILVINVLLRLLGTHFTGGSMGTMDDFLDHSVSVEPAIPEEYAEIYDNMEWLGESMNMLGNENVYGAYLGDDFVIGSTVARVEDYHIESYEDIHGMQLVTVEVSWLEGEAVDPILMSTGGEFDWTTNYYWEMEVDEDRGVYQFLIDSEDEDVGLKLLFEDYLSEPTQEVHIDLQ